MPKINVKDARRKQLMEANIASIVKHGIAGTTITHVSEGAKMSRGIVNFYFTSKDTMMHDTLRYLVNDYAEQTETVLEETKDLPAGERLGAWLKAHFETGLCNAKRLGAWVAFAGEPAQRKLLAASDAAQVKAITPLVKDAFGLDADAAAVKANALYASIQGAWLLYLMAPQSYNKEELHTLCLLQLGTQAPSAPAKRQAPPRKPASGPKLAKPAPAKDTAQMDFEDLLTRRG